jgi:hypothetical protein
MKLKCPTSVTSFTIAYFTATPVRPGEPDGQEVTEGRYVKSPSEVQAPLHSQDGPWMALSSQAYAACK